MALTATSTSTGKSAQKLPITVKPTDGPIIKFPPFPINTEGAFIIPFKDFKEHGIRIFSDTGVEIDGLGIPTVELGVRHELDECKTETRRKLKVGKDLSEGKRGKVAIEAGTEQAKLNPMERAKQQRMQRFLLFAKKEWYDQWSEGEHLRGLNSYDPNLSSITRIHQAATEFRTGRIWPPAHTHLIYLWDQFRLYAGLLGSTPIWTRTDLPQPDGVNDEDENEVEECPTTRSSAAHHRPGRPPNSDDEIDLASDFSEHELGDEFTANISQTKTGQYPQHPPQPPRKRVPPRTPYALYNKEPIPVSSDAEVHALLARAAVEKETKLLAFLSDPEKSVKVFLSSYMRKEGLIWTPSFLTYLPLLVSFFLSFLIRTRALPECERQLKRAVEIAQAAATELPSAGRLCRILPDAMGKGAKGCWGIKWEDKWDFGVSDTNDSKTNEVPVLEEKLKQEDALKMFETEVKKANLQLLSKETMFEPEPLGQNFVGSDDEEIGIQIMSPTSPEPKTPTAFISQMVNIPEAPKATKVAGPHSWGKPNWAVAPNTTALHDSPAQPSPPVIGSALPDSASNPKGKEPQISDDESEDWEEDPRAWASPTGRPPTRSQKLAEKAAWFPPATQPLMGVLGMTVLPLRYESGIAERSLRKVTSVLKPGEVGAGGNSKWRGVEEELVKRLVRVVLGPWPDWDDGGIAPEFKTPTLVGGSTLSSLESTEGGSWKSTPIAHDPLKNDITILVEPNVANSLIVGMGVAGTWVQLIPLKSENAGGGRGDRGRGRGGGGVTGRKEQTWFWYVEELFMAIPSFWTVGEEVEGNEGDEDIDNVWALN